MESNLKLGKNTRQPRQITYSFKGKKSVKTRAFIQGILWVSIYLLLTLAPLLILFIYSPSYLHLLNVLEAPWRALAGVGALVALIVLIAISIWRKKLKKDYTPWRIWHGLLATLAVSLALLHVALVGHYINTPLKQALWTGYGLFWVGLLLYVRVLKPFQLLRRPYTVWQVKPERNNAWTVVLEPKGHAGMRFLPGQFAWLTAWSSPFSNREHPSRLHPVPSDRSSCPLPSRSSAISPAGSKRCSLV